MAGISGGRENSCLMDCSVIVTIQSTVETDQLDHAKVMSSLVSLLRQPFTRQRTCNSLLCLLFSLLPFLLGI